MNLEINEICKTKGKKEQYINPLPSQVFPPGSGLTALILLYVCTGLEQLNKQMADGVASVGGRLQISKGRRLGLSV